jgi:hypothetical protein
MLGRRDVVDDAQVLEFIRKILEWIGGGLKKLA